MVKAWNMAVHLEGHSVNWLHDLTALIRSPQAIPFRGATR